MVRKDELKEMSRLELMDILVSQSEEIARLKQELDETREKLKSGTNGAGQVEPDSQESLRISGVFDAVGVAAQQYLENLKVLYGKEAMDSPGTGIIAETEISVGRKASSESCIDADPEKKVAAGR